MISNRPFKIRSIIACAELPGLTRSQRSHLSQALSSGEHSPNGVWSELRIGPKGRYVGVTKGGKMVVRGGSSVTEAKRALEQVSKRLLGVHRRTLKGFRIANLVATTDYGRKLELARISQAAEFYHTEYEPEIFPGLIVRFAGTKRTAVLFSSGKGIVVGARSLREIRQTIASMERSLSVT
jgi:TATA-box binding protein (TBP) (component of TFIID and TFIIIB)